MHSLIVADPKQTFRVVDLIVTACSSNSQRNSYSEGYPVMEVEFRPMLSDQHLALVYEKSSGEFWGSAIVDSQDV